MICLLPYLSRSALVFEIDEATLTIPNASDVASVSLTTWPVNNSGTENDTTVTLLSSIVGVTLTTVSGNPLPVAVDPDEDGFGLAINVLVHDSSGGTNGDSNNQSLRKQLSCKFFDEGRDEWNERGVFLRGIAVFLLGGDDGDGEGGDATAAAGIGAAAICVTTHMTLFAVADESASVGALESKLQLLQGRISALSAVDLASADTKFNPLVPSLFVIFTVAFVVTVAVAKGRRRLRRPRDVEQARLVYAQFGRLRRSAVVGGDEFEAILRRFLSPAQVVRVVSLQIVTVSPFLSLFFRWSHERIVFTRVDKAYLLYAAVLGTFLVQAFLFDAEGKGTDFGAAVTNVLLGALFANTILLPVQHILPYMISNGACLRITYSFIRVRAYACVRACVRRSHPA